LENFWSALRRTLAELLHSLQEGDLHQNWLFVVDWFLPDAFSAQRTTISVLREGQSEWEELTEVSPKPLFFGGDNEYDHGAYYRVLYPVSGTKPITACRFESRGYGGQGIRAVELLTPAGKSVPTAVTEVHGQVQNPEHLLDNSSTWCMLGETDTQRAFLTPALAQATHRVTLSMGKGALSFGTVGPQDCRTMGLSGRAAHVGEGL